MNVCMYVHTHTHKYYTLILGSSSNPYIISKPIIFDRYYDHICRMKTKSISKLVLIFSYYQKLIWKKKTKKMKLLPKPFCFLFFLHYNISVFLTESFFSSMHMKSRTDYKRDTTPITAMTHEIISDNTRKAKEHFRQGGESNLSRWMGLLNSLKIYLFF